MSDPPRRRRSSSSTPPPSRGGGGMVGTIALSLGVIIAGLGIGALISAFQSRNQSATGLPSPIPVVTPVVMETRPPVALMTPTAEPSATASPSPSPEPSESPSPSPNPTRRPTPSPSPSGTAIPSPATTATAGASATPVATAKPVAAVTSPATLAPRVTERATPPPPPPPPPVPVARPVTTIAPTPVATQPPPAAQGLVRRYVNALIAGDERTAYAALGGSPGDGGLSLKEEAFIDREARITSLRSSRSDPATVEVEITSSRGSYYATYHVAQGANGAYIDQHDYIKV